MKTSCRGTAGAMGSVYARENDKQDVGIGEQEIKAIREGDRIDDEIRLKKPFQFSDFSLAHDGFRGGAFFASRREAYCRVGQRSATHRSGVMMVSCVPLTP